MALDRVAARLRPRQLTRLPRMPAPVASARSLHGELETPRPLHAPGGKISLRGWCLLAGSPVPPPVRLIVGDTTLAASPPHARTDVPALFPAEPAAALCGFTLEGSLPPGLHLARLEAQTPDGAWHAFKSFTVHAEPAPFLAALDEPLTSGTLHDRVKVGGWALDLTAPVESLTLRYGHREISCTLHQPRADVAAAFPSVSHAARAGFVSEDFLVAGHGPVRINARLADGSTRIVETPVTFSVATDENHGPELNLAAATRLPFPTALHSPAPAPVSPVPRPLNLLFVLPGSFTANSALHVAALANELADRGHDCVVAVAHEVETIANYDRPRFRGVLHRDAAAGPVHRDGRAPDLIHAWTPRENVRRLTATLRARSTAKLVVHLEDNEQEILALTLGRSWDELLRLPTAELDRLVPPDLSHPHHSRALLESADGVSVITDKLRAFVPPGKPVQLMTPAADARYFYPRARPEEFRRVLDVSPDTSVLFYHGNVHAANAAEVRELYAAVLALNRAGEPVTLIRAGIDAVDFLGELAPQVAPHVLNLGQILRHRLLAPLMALADIFVQPGQADAFNDYRFPSKLPEFFSVGRPVILPRTNLGELLRPGVDALVLDRADAAGIADAVRTLRADPALAARLAQGAVEFAATHFSWPRSAAALAKFYASLATS